MDREHGLQLRRPGAGLRQVAIFHSPPDHVRRHRSDMPFPLVADPDRDIYTRFGVGATHRALLHPRAMRRLLTEVRAGHTDRVRLRASP